MRDFIVKAIINAVAIVITAYVVPGINVTQDLVPLFIVGAVITILNMLIKPVLKILSLPFILVTFGLFILVVNAIVLSLAAWLAGPSFNIDGVFPAILGGVVMAIVNMILERVFGTKR